jgi:DNA replication and repair protein RecF
MNLKKVTLRNVRNINQLSLDTNQTTILIGANGSGKTSVLEAVELLYGSEQLLRGKKRDMIQKHKDKMTIQGEFSNKNKQNTTIKLEAILTPPQMRATTHYMINSKKTTRRSINQNYNTVSFSNNDLRLLHGAPARRRRFIDEVASIIHTRQHHQLVSRYEHALQQRNKLLAQIVIHKTRRKDEEFNFWTNKLIETGSSVIYNRISTFEIIVKTFKTIYTQFNTPPLTCFNYKSSLKIDHAISQDEISSKFRTNIEKSREKEEYVGHTIIGPHIDDIYIEQNKVNIVDIFSRGEQRKIIIMLKVCEKNIIQDVKKNNPLMLLDDVLFELDDANKFLITQNFNDLQTIYTGTKKEDFPLSILNNADIFSLQEGSLC